MAFRLTHRLLASAVFPAILAAAPGAAETGQAARSAMTVNLPLLFDRAYLGDIAARIDSDGNPVLSGDRFVALLGERLSPEAIDAISVAAARDGGLNVATAKTLGIDIAYDPSTLEIMVSIAIAAQGKQGLSAVDSRRLEQPRATIEPEGFSATAIVSMKQSYDWPTRGIAGRLRAFDSAAELAANVGGAGGVSLFADIGYRGGEGGGFERGNVVLLHDDLKRAIRYSAGDVAPVVTGYQTAPLIGGVSIQRAYGTLQPFRNIRPSGQYSFVLERESTVDVVVNGSVLRTIRLEPGQYNLRDFPFFSGLNEVQLYVVDDAGRRLLTSFSQYFSARLLEPKVFEFGLTVGLIEQANARGAGFDRYNGRPGYSGFFRYGLTPSIMVGANLQGASNQTMGGFEVAVATPVGTFVGLASASRRASKGSGHAILLGYEGSAQSLGPLLRPQVNVEVEIISRNFSPLATIAPVNRIRRSAQARFTAQLPGGFGFGLSVARFVGRDTEPDQTRSAVTLSRRLGRINLAGTYERIDTRGPLADRNLLITATLPLGRQATARSSYNSRGRLASFEYSRFQPDEIDTFGIRAAIARGDDGYTAAGEFSYNANRFAANLTHRLITEPNLGRVRSQETALSVQTQVALAGRSVALGRPVGPRFAIVSAHSSLADSSIEVRQGAGRDHPQARTGLLGGALAPAGNAYTASELRVDSDDLPDGYDLGDSSFVTLPSPAAGYAITVGSNASKTLIGTALDTAGAPIGLQGGTLKLVGDANSEPQLVFTNRAGRFAGNGLKPGRYELVLGDRGQYRGIIEVPEKSTGIVMLGRVTLTQDPR